jgi:hypothetical protein
MVFYKSKQLAFLILVWIVLGLRALGVPVPVGNVTLGWDPSTAPDVAGYRLYVGETSGNYTSVIDVGNATTATVSNLTVGTTYYFALTAYDSTGLESPLSSEISYVVAGPPPPPAQGSVTLAWDGSSAPDVAGYRVYYGQTSQNYSQMLDVGSATSAKISGLTVGVTYYFVVTAYTSDGLESPFSSEISYVITAPSVPTLQLSAMTGQPGVLSGAAPQGYQYQVLATADLQNWSVIGTITVGSSSSFQFVDPAPPTAPARFYRLRQTAP